MKKIKLDNQEMKFEKALEIGDFVKVKAKKNNIPYQTLLNSLIHQFADDRMVVQI